MIFAMTLPFMTKPGWSSGVKLLMNLAYESTALRPLWPADAATVFAILAGTLIQVQSEAITISVLQFE